MYPLIVILPSLSVPPPPFTRLPAPSHSTPFPRHPSGPPSPHPPSCPSPAPTPPPRVVLRMNCNGCTNRWRNARWRPFPPHRYGGSGGLRYFGGRLWEDWRRRRPTPPPPTTLSLTRPLTGECDGVRTRAAGAWGGNPGEGCSTGGRGGDQGGARQRGGEGRGGCFPLGRQPRPRQQHWWEGQPCGRDP